VAEEWHPIAGYEGHYEVSSYGRVRSIARVVPHKLKGKKTIPECILQQKVTSGTGYLTVNLQKGGTAKRFYVHRLVAAAFHGEPNEGQMVNHKDHNRQNNQPSNLEWCTHSENMRHALSNPLHRNNKYFAVRQQILDATYGNIRTVAESLGVSARAAYDMRHNHG
jgi:hypothetical protein